MSWLRLQAHFYSSLMFLIIYLLINSILLLHLLYRFVYWSSHLKSVQNGAKCLALPLIKCAFPAHYLRLRTIWGEQWAQWQFCLCNFCATFSGTSENIQLRLNMFLLKVPEIEIVDSVFEGENCVDVWIVSNGQIRGLGIMVVVVQGDEGLHCAVHWMLHAENLINKAWLQLNFCYLDVKYVFQKI